MNLQKYSHYLAKSLNFESKRKKLLKIRTTHDTMRLPLTGIQILTAHEGNGGKLLSPEVTFNLSLLRALVNSRLRLN